MNKAVGKKIEKLPGKEKNSSQVHGNAQANLTPFWDPAFFIRELLKIAYTNFTAVSMKEVSACQIR